MAKRSSNSESPRKSRNVKELWEDAWRKYGVGKFPQTEFRFHPERKWRFDYAWPGQFVAVETDGYGLGHLSPWSLSNDHEKSNAAQQLGWIVFRFTARQLGSEEKRKIAARQVVATLKQRRIQLGV